MLEKGIVIRSTAGRDRGRLMLVAKVVENGVLVCDGKERPLERLKLKNIRHVEETQFRLDTKDTASNRRLRKALREIEEKENEQPREVFQNV